MLPDTAEINVALRKQICQKKMAAKEFRRLPTVKSY